MSDGMGRKGPQARQLCWGLFLGFPYCSTASIWRFLRGFSAVLFCEGNWDHAEAWMHHEMMKCSIWKWRKRVWGANHCGLHPSSPCQWTWYSGSSSLFRCKCLGSATDCGGVLALRAWHLHIPFSLILVSGVGPEHPANTLFTVAHLLP